MKEGRLGFSHFGSFWCHLQIPQNTLLQEGLHVIDDHIGKYSSMQFDCVTSLIAPQEHGERTLGSDVELGTQKCPACIDVLRWSRQFEVVNIDNKEELEFVMEVHRRPFRSDRDKADRLDITVALDFPHGDTIGMTVERLQQDGDWISH